MSPKAKNAAMQALVNGTRYPDGAAQVVREAAAVFAGVSPDEVIVGNGSDEILGLIARTVLAFIHSIPSPFMSSAPKSAQPNVWKCPPRISTWIWMACWQRLTSTRV